MTTAADDSAVEDAFEALLAGRPVPEGVAGLAAFTEAVRTSATRPGRPSAALAELLATGLLIDQSSPSARTASTAGSPPARRSALGRIRRRTAMIFPVLLAKFLSAGAVAQAATGAGIAVVVVTGAGAVGVLPTPVQDTVAAAVETVTPLDLPSSDDDGTDDGTDGSAPDEVAPPETGEDGTVVEEPADPAAFDAVTWALEGPQDAESFGAWVRQGAGDRAVKEALKAEGRNFGSVVREWARSKGLAEEELAAELESEGVELDDPADGTPEVTPVPDTGDQSGTAGAQVAPADGDRPKSNGGNGNGNGNGGGAAKDKGNGRN